MLFVACADTHNTSTNKQNGIHPTYIVQFLNEVKVALHAILQGDRAPAAAVRMHRLCTSLDRLDLVCSVL
jgi:hypothetical protein